MLPALVFAAACVPTTAAPRHAAGAQLGQRLLQAYIQPSTRDLHAGARRLHARLRDYCRRPGNAGLRSQVEEQFGAVVAAWARVELLRFGPLIEANRLEHFFFWPDPRAVVQRQMRGLLANADQAVLGPALLRQQSAAVQGLPGLEYALFADDAAREIASGSAAGRYRCDLATAVAGNLARLAGEIEAGWQQSASLAQELARPGPDRSVYRSQAEVATETLKALSTALHAARDQKLTPALGATAAEARGALLPLHRSGLTNRYFAAMVRGWMDYLDVSQLGTALPSSERWIHANLHGELQRILDDFNALEMPASLAAAAPEQRDLLVHAGLLLANARSIIDEYLAPALGVNLGFNSLDGD